MSTSLFSQTFRHNGSAVFGTMPPMCRSCPDVNKLRGMETTILGQHRPFMSIKSFVQHSGWQEMVSLCSLIRLIGVCADRDQPEFLCSRSDSRHLEVHVATAGGWLTRYRPREVRNSIYRYRKIHIDYRSKYLYRFISPISIIYGNTSHEWPPFVQCQLALLFLIYCCFKIWQGKFKVKVMTKVKSQNQWLYFSFCGNQTIFGWDIENFMFDLENLRSRSWPRSNLMATFKA